LQLHLPKHTHVNYARYIYTHSSHIAKQEILLLRYYTFNDFDPNILSASFPTYVENNKDRKPAMAILISHIATLHRKKDLSIVKVRVKEKGIVKDNLFFK
jgi:hypothetical protein